MNIYEMYCKSDSYDVISDDGYYLGKVQNKGSYYVAYGYDGQILRSHCDNKELAEYVILDEYVPQEKLSKVSY